MDFFVTMVNTFLRLTRFLLLTIVLSDTGMDFLKPLKYIRGRY